MIDSWTLGAGMNAGLLFGYRPPGCEVEAAGTRILGEGLPKDAKAIDLQGPYILPRLVDSFAV